MYSEVDVDSLHVKMVRISDIGENAQLKAELSDVIGGRGVLYRTCAFRGELCEADLYWY